MHSNRAPAHSVRAARDRLGPLGGREGPKDLRSLFTFPTYLADLFGNDSDPDVADELLQEIEGWELPYTAQEACCLFWPKLQLHTRYSGIGMAEIACSVLTSHLKAAGALPQDTPDVFCCEAFDLKPHAREALLALSPPPYHVFSDQLQLLHPKMREAMGIILAPAQRRMPRPILPIASAFRR